MDKDNEIVESFGKGGIKDKPDERDYQYSQIAEGTAPFDWSKPFDVEISVSKIPVKNQYQSYSCGGQAWASYSYILDQSIREEKSAKFIYAQTHVGSGGSDGRTNSNLCVKKGVSSEKDCPSYLPDGTTSEAFITNVGDITALAYADALTNEEKTYWSVNTDIESIAQAVRDNNGVVIGIYGQNNGTWLTKFPLPPTDYTQAWAHWVYVGKALMINGKKYLGFLNSWGVSVGEQGWQYISEDYFPKGIWSCWAMVYNTQAVQKFVFTKILRLGSTGLDTKMLQTKLGITADGIFGKITMKTVMDFQHNHGLVADGIVGKLTNQMLNSF